MTRPRSLPEERHPTLETFERVLNNGVMVIQLPKELQEEPPDDVEKSDDESHGSTHPLFFGETWKVSPSD
jgi:hypothetical protein